MSVALLVTSAQPHLTGKQVQDSLYSALAQSRLCTMGTVNATDGSPHVNSCFFSSTTDFRLFVFTSPRTTHAQNIASRPSCAINVLSSTQNIGDDLLGCQLFGTAKLLNPVQGLKAFQSFVERFEVFLTWAATLDVVFHKFESRFYEITIDSGKLLDEAAFGKEEYVTFRIDRS